MTSILQRTSFFQLGQGPCKRGAVLQMGKALFLRQPDVAHQPALHSIHLIKLFTGPSSVIQDPIAAPSHLLEKMPPPLIMICRPVAGKSKRRSITMILFHLLLVVKKQKPYFSVIITVIKTKIDQNVTTVTTIEHKEQNIFFLSFCPNIFFSFCPEMPQFNLFFCPEMPQSTVFLS